MGSPPKGVSHAGRGDNVRKLFEIYLKIKLVKSVTELVRAVAVLIRAIKSR